MRYRARGASRCCIIELCAGSGLVTRPEAKQASEADCISYDTTLPVTTSLWRFDIVSSEEAIAAGIGISDGAGLRKKVSF